MSQKRLGNQRVLSSFLNVFMISVSLNSWKVNISLLFKCFLVFLVEWF